MAPNCPTIGNRPLHQSVGSRTRHTSFTDDDLADLNLFRESDRLRTFENWTVRFIDKKALAKAGFYYTNRGDSVVCPYCRIKVGCWCPEDDPLTEHELHSPICPFVVSRKRAAENHEDEDVDPEGLLADEAGPRGEDTCGPFSIQGRQSPVLVLQTMSPEAIELALNVNCTENPRFSEYSTHRDRYRTFDNWPKESLHTPEELSEAGFFYVGERDGCQCFHCGGTLFEWSPTDNPWVEHALWYPNCKYVQSVKGQKFIDSARKMKHDGLNRTREEIQATIDTLKELVGQVDVNNANSKEKVDDSPSEENNGNESKSRSSLEKHAEDEKADVESRMTCLICLEAERDSILLPCYHVVACQSCANKLTKCCFCRQPVFYRRQIFMP